METFPHILFYGSGEFPKFESVFGDFPKFDLILGKQKSYWRSLNAKSKLQRSM